MRTAPFRVSGEACYKGRMDNGTLQGLWSLARPKGGLLLLVLPSVGLGFAHWDHAQDLRCAPVAIHLLLLAWLAVHAGTMWWNAALDHGEDDVLWGMPGRVPERLGLASLGACALGVALASAAHALAGAALLLASLLSLLYSHPRIALKGHPVGGPLVNLLGYGILAPLSGWCLADLPLTPRLGLALTFLSCVVLGLYFGAQAFQGEEDRRRGHRTLVVTQGPRVAVRAARMLLVASLVVLALACLAGFFPRLCLLGLLALPALDRHMREWERAPGGGTRRHAEGMLTASLVVAVLLVGLATLDWRLDLRAGGPVAGLATARGRPGPLP